LCNTVQYLIKNVHLKKSFKTSESVNRRRTGNTLTKRKRTKGQTTIYKIYM